MNTRKNIWSRPLAAVLAVVLLLGMLPVAWADGTQPAIRITNGDCTIKIGETVQLTAEVTPEGTTVKWESSDSDVARVDASGLVTAVGSGTVRITAGASVASGDQTLTASTDVTITVKPKDPPPSVTVSPKSLKLQVGATGSLSAVVSTNEQAVWASSDTSVVTVDNDSGTVTAVNVGTATVTASAGGASDTCTVTVIKAVTGITLSASSVDVEVNGRIGLSAAVEPSDATNKKVTWHCDSDVAAVDSNGIVTGRREGVATITAKTDDGGFTAACTVNVKPAAIVNVTGVTISPSPATVEIGKDVQLTASIAPSNATDKGVSWTSNDASIATVNPSTGLVRGVKAGTAVITATTSDGGKTAACNVQVTGTVPVTGVALNYGTKTIAVGESFRLTPSISPSNATNKEVTWSSSSTTYATVDANGLVTGRSAGTVVITVRTKDGSKTATCAVTVTKTTASAITYQVDKDEEAAFDDRDFNKACRSLTGAELDYVWFSLPASSRGTLYYDYDASDSSNEKVSSSKNYYYTSPRPYIERITFVPKEGYTGTVTIDYTGRNVNKEEFTGTVEITVGKGSSGSGDVEYTTARNTPVNLFKGDFDDYSKDETGYSFDVILFNSLPSSSKGTLYYDYNASDKSHTKVKTTTEYGRNSSPYLNYVTFVPADGYTGTVTIPFTGYNTKNREFTGELVITVGKGSSGSGDVEYTTPRNTPVTLEEDDFDDYSKDETGYSFDVIQFTTLPSSSKGTLYYDYNASDKSHTKVKTTTEYGSSSSPYLDYITFVPADGYTGTVTIPFDGYNTRNRKFTGELVITVGSGDDAITYTTGKNTAVDLKERDFVDFSKDQTNNSTFDYVRFTTLPSASKGVLYYDYAVSAKNNEKVLRNEKFYRAESPYLEDITFVPADGYTGTVTIPFDGESASGREFSGELKITVGSGGDVTYSADAGQSVSFDAADFNAYCRDETGANLDFVEFTLPNSSQGALYSGTKKAASSATKYYRSSPSPYLNDVSFAPAKSTTGTIRIPFTGESVKGDEFSGTVVISYTAAAGVVKYSSTGGAVTFRAKDFSDICAARGGSAALSTVRFDTATTNSGRLYASYSNGAGTTASTSTDYKVSGTPSLGNVTFVPKAGYSGKINLTYTGTDANGGTYRGMVEITVTPAAANTGFKDMGNHSWAASSVEFLSSRGVVTGVDTTHYGPANPMSRGDFVLMLYRAFGLKSSGKVSFADVPQNSYYAEAIAAAKALGIATGTNNRFNPTAPLTRQDAMVLLQRTMSATGRPLTAGDASVLSSFTDRGRVSDYAVNAVAALVRTGLIKGDNGRINPTSTITRAEMAVLLHRVLTM